MNYEFTVIPTPSTSLGAGSAPAGRGAEETADRRNALVLKHQNKFYFKVIALLSPFLILFSLETGLRIFGYGVNLDDIFLMTADRQYFHINKDITKRYFASGQATTGVVDFFKARKDARTFRLFVLGESAALGFPYPDNISFPRMLKYALMEAFLEKDIEVINLSFSAVNSYTFYDLGKELHRFDPDAVLIYGGHNEYYGALGVASTVGAGGHPAFIRCGIFLNRTRVMQLLHALLPRPAGEEERQSDNLMKRVAGQYIDYGGAVYQKGIEQFKTNMDKLLGALCREQIPVYLSTVAVNLKDMKPLHSCTPETPDAPDSLDADTLYALGRSHYLRGDSEQARSLFLMAYRHDCLRFRAPEEVNDYVRSCAATLPGVFLVEAEAALAGQFEHHLTGHEVLLEHVHPNIRGHRIIAETFFRSVAPLCGTPPPQNTDSILHNYPVLTFDTLAGHYAYRQLMAGFPFYEKTAAIQLHTPVEQLAYQHARGQKNWYRSMEELCQYALSVKDWPLVCDVLRARIIDNPYDPDFYFPLAKVCELTGRHSDAVKYFEAGSRLKAKR
jgi:tetratricopeptide (TPR) repeat protein